MGVHGALVIIIMVGFLVAPQPPFTRTAVGASSLTGCGCALTLKPPTFRQRLSFYGSQSAQPLSSSASPSSRESVPAKLSVVGVDGSAGNGKADSIHATDDHREALPF